MKVSQAGLQKIKDRIDEISGKLSEMAGMTKLNSLQREDFRDLQEQLWMAQRQYRVFSDPDSGT